MSNPHNFLKFKPNLTLGGSSGSGTSQGNSTAERLKVIDAGSLNAKFPLSLNSVHTGAVRVGKFTTQETLTDTMNIDDVPNGVKVSKLQVVLFNTEKEGIANFNMSFSTDAGSSFSISYLLSSLNQSTAFGERGENTPLVTFDVPQQFVDEYEVGKSGFQVRLTAAGTEVGSTTSIDAVELYVFLKDTPSLKLKNGTMRVRGGNVLIKK